MSESTTRKLAFYREMVAHGIHSPEQISEAFPLGSNVVPPEEMESWLRKFLRHGCEGTGGSAGRYVNRFRLGADPELIFTQKIKDYEGNLRETRQDATAFKMKQGMAFGADNNGRLAEIRPYPSRSALEVVASVLSTLRWMIATVPETAGYDWRCGAFLYQDGLGGHVHFGRKRPSRGEEIKALDNLNEILMQLRVYPASECMARRKGDGHNQKYGMPGDYRLQKHGYEYRTFPSWLDSPELAFLTLTLSKLAVHQPKLVHPFQTTVSDQRQYHRICNLLAFYKGLDDDARLAYFMLKRGLPNHVGGDFKVRWGLGGLTEKISGIKYIPSAISPSPEEVEEVRGYLLHAVPLKMRVPKPTWSPVGPPKGYRMVIDSVETYQQKGLGEMVQDWVVSDEIPVQVTSGARVVQVSSWLVEKLGPEWKKGLQGTAQKFPHGEAVVQIPPQWREGPKAGEMRKILLNGTLPIWRLRDVKESSLADWKAKVEEEKKKKNKKVLFQTRLVGTEGPAFIEV